MRRIFWVLMVALSQFAPQKVFGDQCLCYMQVTIKNVNPYDVFHWLRVYGVVDPPRIGRGYGDGIASVIYNEPYDPNLPPRSTLQTNWIAIVYKKRPFRGCSGTLTASFKYGVPLLNFTRTYELTKNKDIQLVRLTFDMRGVTSSWHWARLRLQKTNPPPTVPTWFFGFTPFITPGLGLTPSSVGIVPPGGSSGQ